MTKLLLCDFSKEISLFVVNYWKQGDKKYVSRIKNYSKDNKKYNSKEIEDNLQTHPMIRSSYIEGTNVGASRVPAAPLVMFMLNGSWERNEKKC